MSIHLISYPQFNFVKRAARLAFGVMLFCLVSAAPAQATRLPGELTSTLKAVFPECRIRLDGSVEAKDGELYLPILPKTPGSAKAVRLKETFPPVPTAKSKTDLYCFDDGYIYLRVVRNLNIKTFASFNEVPEAMRKIILAGHLPVDLIVPNNFALPASMRLIVGEVAINILKELPASALPESEVKKMSEQAVVKAGSGSGHGVIFVTSPSIGTISFVSEETMKKTAEMPTEGTPAGMAVADGRLYIADQSKNRILILDLKEKSFLEPIDLPDKSRPKSVVALPNGKLLYVSESGLGQVAVIEVETSKVLLTSKVPTGPSRMAITPDGSMILILNVPTGQMTFLATGNQKTLATIPIGTNPSAVVVSPDGRFGYASCRGNNYVAIIDIANKKMLGGLKTGNSPTGLAIDREGKKLYVALAKDNKIAVFDASTRALIKEIALPSEVDFPGTLCLLPDGKRLVVSSASTNFIGILNLEKDEFEDKPEIGHGTDETYFVPVN